MRCACKYASVSSACSCAASARSCHRILIVIEDQLCSRYICTAHVYVGMPVNIVVSDSATTCPVHKPWRPHLKWKARIMPVGMPKNQYAVREGVRCVGAVTIRLTYNICSRCNALQLMCQPAEPLMREQVDSQLDLLPSECQSTCR